MQLVELEDYAIAHTIRQAGITIATIHNIGIFAYHCYKMPPKLKSHRIHLLSTIVLLSFVLYDITVLITNYYDYPSHLFPCRWQVYLSIMTYVWAKVSILYLYLERLFIVFKGSDLQFKKPFVLFTRTMITIILIFWPIMLFLFNHQLGKIIDGECFADYPFWMTVLTLFQDLTISICVLILFSRRLLMLSIRVSGSFQSEKSDTNSPNSSKRSRNRFDTSEHPKAPPQFPRGVTNYSHDVPPMQMTMTDHTSTSMDDDVSRLAEINSISVNNSNDNDNDNKRLSKLEIPGKHNDKKKKKKRKKKQSAFGNDKKLLSVVKKTTILSMVAILSSFFVYLLTSIGLISMWVAIDLAVNSWCTILMFQTYHVLYEKLCCAPRAMLSEICLSCCACYCFCCTTLCPLNNKSWNVQNDYDEPESPQMTKPPPPTRVPSIGSQPHTPLATIHEPETPTRQTSNVDMPPEKLHNDSFSNANHKQIGYDNENE